MTNEYAVTEEDLKGGGGNSAKPIGKYTGQIVKAESKKDKNQKIYLALQIKITHGNRKNGVIFDNYIPLGGDANGFQKARRNSLYKALGLKAGAIPYGVPGGPAVDLLVGTYVDIQLEHEFEQVPGEQYSLQTSKSSKSTWKTAGWDKNSLDSKGNLVRSPGGTEFDAPIAPKEFPTFYELSDEFEGIGDPNGAAPDAPVADEAADEDDWGV